LSVPILVNCRDRLGSLLELLAFLERAGHTRIHLVDNASTYPPLLEYFESTPFDVVRLDRNVGHTAMWDANLFDELGVDGRFVLTDPDIVPVEDCPIDAVEYFGEILDSYPDRAKVGFGLKIDDLPDAYRFKRQAISWESQFWQRPIAPRLYDAEIDTTFALYRTPGAYRRDHALRTGHPYLARHTTWYLDDTALPEDELYYRQHAERDLNNWSRDELTPWLADEIAARELASRESGALDLGEASGLSGHDLLRASGWSSEPEPHDEAANTPWAEPGWHAWNNMSPEVELTEFVVALAAALRPQLTIETGTGQGFVTRRLAGVMADGQRLLCFESDAVWREALATLPFFDEVQRSISARDTPSDEELAASALAYLDSDPPLRLSEIRRWRDRAAPGAVLVVHDAGNGHGRGTPHAELRALITALAIPGFFLANPRGAFVGVSTRPIDERPSRIELQARLDVVEAELHALMNTKTFRYSRPARRLYAGLRGSRLGDS